ncbi:MAG: hypothetical protein ACTHW2_09045 [Tissierella sp.]|uniref:hypothetical protein n=1 Tax=Tissierella sp. TaxID=41274 RepID=UPI003F9DE414
MKVRKIIGLGLVVMLVFASITACTSNPPNKEDGDEEIVEDENTNEDNNDSASDPEINNSKYTNYVGTISEINMEEDQLIVAGKEESNFENISFNITSNTVIASDQSEEIIDIEKAKKGDKVEAIYDKESPMTKSLPPITNAKALIIRDSDREEKLAIKLSKFDENLISEDNSLELKINDDTSIVDLDGNLLTKDDIVNKEVLVFFGPAETLSIPGQSNAKTIILL